MAKIHGAVFIGIGAFISVMSLMVAYERFIFFFYSGIAFLIYGFSKLLIEYLSSGEESKTTIQKRAHHQTHHPHLQQRISHPPHYKYCPRCGNVLRTVDRFCSYCGSRA
jgi:UDP-N-acetylmuramyl pentapeptide phosphotransferase/UDP-N-acetylglucosamine-1-phosphate transferase